MQDIEDTFHFICVCPRFKELRIKYIKKCYYIRPSVYKYNVLMKSNNKNELCKLALFLKGAVDARNKYLNNIDK